MPAIITMPSSGGDSDIAYRARYTGEQFTLVLKALTRDFETLNMSDASLSMTLTKAGAGTTIEKTAGDFTCPYDSRDSRASVVYDTDDTATSGEYIGQLVIDRTAGTGDLIKGDPITIILMSGDEALTLADLRQALGRDVPESNEFLEDRELSDATLAYGRKRAIDDWNGMPGRHHAYTTDNFPARWVEPWRGGATAHSLEMQANNLERNRVMMSAGGIDADERGARAQAYRARAQELRAMWRLWIKQQQMVDTIDSSFVSYC